MNKGFFNFKDSERPHLILNIIIFKYAAEGQHNCYSGCQDFSHVSDRCVPLHLRKKKPPVPSEIQSTTIKKERRGNWGELSFAKTSRTVFRRKTLAIASHSDP